ncbi:hypothetical protein BCO18430_03376 [Burkholderia contaminans]|uniref:hypothetical protein n=1 Tax=Burkholderia contaminans TaxID=488447 RepID=UPI001453575A|nr:hypothetical protein [Burkholderia contaminans]VWC93017.1 hypothetical protein BCO18430_03376 [Burkholderia contaminans]
MSRRTTSALLMMMSLLTSVDARAIEADARLAPLMGVPVMTGLSRVRPADSLAAPPTSLDTVRNRLKAIAPFAYQALQAIEAQRRTRYRDSEIPAVARTPEFQAELNQAVQRFCENPQNASSLACPSVSTPANTSASAGPRDSDVLATARKTLSGNEEVIAPSN